MIFAIVYYLIAWYLDRTGRHGVAVPFVVVGIPAMLVGIGALAPDTKQIGTGILLLLVGLVLCLYGAKYARRFTAWFWGLVSAAGAVTILTKFATQGVSIGIAMIVLGVVFAAGGWFAAKSLNEPDDMADGATRPTRRCRPERRSAETVGSAAWPMSACARPGLPMPVTSRGSRSRPGSTVTPRSCPLPSSSR